MRLGSIVLFAVFSHGPVLVAQGAGAGAVPDGKDVPGTQLLLAKGPGSELTLSWTSSCMPTDTDYEIYTGPVGDFTRHGPRFCSTGGNTSQSFLPASGDVFYLVVPHNDVFEGSYGSRSDGAGRPRGAVTCRPQSIACGIAPPNVAPVGVADSWITPTDQTATIDVLANDSDPDGGPQPLFVVSVTVPRNGVASVGPTGEVLYTPGPGFVGTDAFDYTLSDGEQQTSIPVDVTIGPSPPDPVCTFSASPDSLPSGGGASTLTWSSTGAVRATLNGGRVGVGGNLVVHPITTATYTLKVHGQPGTDPATCRQTINVPDLGCLAGEICPVECGSGVLTNFATGGLINLPPEDRIHVLILADGYTGADIDQFHTAPCPDWDLDPDDCNDVEAWLNEWEQIDIYDQFRDAFCFWKMPALSAINAVPGGITENTAFFIRINENESVDLSFAPTKLLAEERIWQVIEQFPYPPTSFYPADEGGAGSDRTDRGAKNLVVVVMIYKTAIGRSGYGGKAYFLENPDDPDERVLSAMAHNRPHEFTHALTRLWDEYIDLSTGPPGNCQPNEAAFESKGLSNVVCDPVCAVLPWSHLLFGQGINPVDELVGAFGVPEEGYHSELLCLMNGTRESNGDVFGGNDSLRAADRMCNYCREVTTFRILERIHQLDIPAWSYGAWEAVYRQPFFDTYGFFVPAVVPQESGPGVVPDFDDYTCVEIP